MFVSKFGRLQKEAIMTNVAWRNGRNFGKHNSRQ
jgi:hypothetical protein